MKNRICSLFNIQYPIIQGGMVWCSGWELVTAVSNAGGLGLIGAGSMHPDNLRHHIQRVKQHTNKPFGVNVPLLYPEMDKVMQIIVDEKVPIVFTSAGSPSKWTPFLKEHGITVAHVVSSAKFALKAQSAGVDAIVAEGFEAGGHNGREETTTLVLTPSVKKAITIPLIAAGGIATGDAILAVMALGAEGVQIGSRFAVSKESSAHVAFKQRVVDSGEGDTMLCLKKLAPARLLNNAFYQMVAAAENNGASTQELTLLLGKGRAKKGIFEGDINEGELEIGQVNALINDIPTVADIFHNLITEYAEAHNRLQSNSLF